MNDRLLIIAVILAAVGGALWYLSDEVRVAGLRDSLGLEQPLATDVEELDAEAMAAELARLAALPVPGVEAGEGPPPTLGALADAALDCAVETGAMLRAPKQRARDGVRRYLLVFGAIGSAPPTPLLEPRFAALGPLIADGPEAAARAAEGLPEAERALLADYHTTYSDVAHPLYHGLQLYDQTFEALDFETLAGAVAARPLALWDCAAPRVLPAPEAAPQAWRCEDEAGPIRTTLLPTEPPGLQLERGGEMVTGVQVPAASGARYEGPFGAFWTRGEEAILERPDGSTARCVPAGNGG